MAAIASSLIFTPEKLWEPLSEEGKRIWQNGFTVLTNILFGLQLAVFMILVNIALKKLDCRYSEAVILRS